MDARDLGVWVLNAVLWMALGALAARDQRRCRSSFDGFRCEKFSGHARGAGHSNGGIAW